MPLISELPHARKVRGPVDADLQETLHFSAD
jgi:hypothetical protein